MQAVIDQHSSAVACMYYIILVMIIYFVIVQFDVGIFTSDWHKLSNYNCMYTQSKNSQLLVYSPVSCLSVNKSIDLGHQFETDFFVLSMIIDLILITHKLICYTCSGVVT